MNTQTNRKEETEIKKEDPQPTTINSLRVKEGLSPIEGGDVELIKMD